LNVRWQTVKGDVLQLVANFSGQAIARPPLVSGETLWGSESDAGHLYLNPADILVRLARKAGPNL
jgi:maltooligosyltrehalose trehalohydrolase